MSEILPFYCVSMLAKTGVMWQTHYIKRGYSLMVKLQPSKLIMRVRFPLPALKPATADAVAGVFFCSKYKKNFDCRK